jgi:hypothetical protein
MGITPSQLKCQQDFPVWTPAMETRRDLINLLLDGLEANERDHLKQAIREINMREVGSVPARNRSQAASSK